jgi:hypothetical protein
VSIYYDQLYFIHQTARNYLSLSKEKLVEVRESESADAATNATHSFGGCLSDRTAHAKMVDCCVAYLAIDQVLAIESGYFDPGRQPATDKHSKKRFLDFSVENWVPHF